VESVDISVHGGLKKSCLIVKIGGKCRYFGAWWIKKSCHIEEIVGKCRYFGAWRIKKE
jgi:hypothetical protein